MVHNGLGHLEDEPSTRPIIEKTKDLLEDIPDRSPPLASPQVAEGIEQKTVNVDLTQITDK